MNPDDITPPGGPATDKQREAAATIARNRVLESFKKQLDNYTDEPAPGADNTPAEPIIDDETKANLGNARYTNDNEREVVDGEKQAQDLDAYHAAWQDYYRRYYEAYYVNAVSKVAAGQAKQAPSQKHIDSDDEPDEGKSVDSVKDKIKHHAKKHAKKIRKSRHFVPVIAGLLVVLAFLFMQYNRVLVGTVSAFIMPDRVETGINPIDPPGAIVGPDPLLIIPRINVRVPIVFNVALDHASQMRGMEEGVIHFAIPGANSVPGQVGNTVLSGHSSNDVFARGDYGFIFAQLERLDIGNELIINYQGERYVYNIIRKQEVLPTQVDALFIPEAETKPMVTLITCVPVGTALRRLLVFAEQISPNPNEAAPAPEVTEPTEDDVKMPAMSLTLLERIWSFVTGRGWPQN